MQCANLYGLLFLSWGSLRRVNLDRHTPICYVNYRIKAYHLGMSAHSTHGWTKHKTSYSNILPYFPKFWSFSQVKLSCSKSKKSNEDNIKYLLLAVEYVTYLKLSQKKFMKIWLIWQNKRSPQLILFKLGKCTLCNMHYSRGNWCLKCLNRATCYKWSKHLVLILIHAVTNNVGKNMQAIKYPRSDSTHDEHHLRCIMSSYNGVTNIKRLKRYRINASVLI